MLFKYSDFVRLLLFALILCSAQAARDEVLAYTQERKQFGKPLVDFQAVQLRLAEMEMKTTAARLLIHAAASRAVGIKANRFTARACRSKTIVWRACDARVCMA
jgi:alkylation response protein AidB-like acyl-CoA dehydrogenase